MWVGFTFFVDQSLKCYRNLWSINYINTRKQVLLKEMTVSWRISDLTWIYNSHDYISCGYIILPNACSYSRWLCLHYVVLGWVLVCWDIIYWNSSHLFVIFSLPKFTWWFSQDPIHSCMGFWDIWDIFLKMSLPFHFILYPQPLHTDFHLMWS